MLKNELGDDSLSSYECSGRDKDVPFKLLGTRDAIGSFCDLPLPRCTTECRTEEHKQDPYPWTNKRLFSVLFKVAVIAI